MARLILALFLVSGYISSLAAGVPTENTSDSLTTRDFIEERSITCDSQIRCCARLDNSQAVGPCTCHSAGWRQTQGTACCQNLIRRTTYNLNNTSVL
ncbi:uncharacterized protein RSE6_13399 [Rhynchosporium secalis]|uniref:Uncharacterized protein n=1 Tax=Rhynchosporium secalis TaxID=38038 RepID=A0A1E1MSV4_RHYSE|nr:uncharacterized protein RSE6_13399 [Rhynchosporium secalis]